MRARLRSAPAAESVVSTNTPSVAATRFGLTRCTLNEESSVAIARSRVVTRKYRALEWLDVDGTYARGLRGLNLARTQLTPEGVDALVAWPHYHGLKTIWVSPSDDYVDALRACWPHVSVRTDLQNQSAF